MSQTARPATRETCQPEISPRCCSTKYAREARPRGAGAARVARALAAAEPEARRAYGRRASGAQDKGVIPAGRINSAPAPRSRPLINCFVQRWAARSTNRRRKARHITPRSRGGRTMRRARRVATLFVDPARGRDGARHNSRASGPISYIGIFDQSCETVESAGAAAARRWECSLRPSGHRALRARQGRGRSHHLQHLGRVTDAFMSGQADREIELAHSEPAQDVKRRAHLRETALVIANEGTRLWEQIMRATYDHAEPEWCPRSQEPRDKTALLRGAGGTNP